MTKRQTADWIRFCSALATKRGLTGYDGYVETQEVAFEIRAAAKTLHRTYENDCNGFQTWDGREDVARAKRNETRQRNLEKKITDAASEIGCQVYFQTDPRGCPVYLYWQADLDAPRWEGKYKIDSIYSSIGLAVPID